MWLFRCPVTTNVASKGILLDTAALKQPSFLELNLVATWAQFHQRSKYSFYTGSSQKRKKIDDFTVSFTLLGSA